jgi:hypothetical protein
LYSKDAYVIQFKSEEEVEEGYYITLKLLFIKYPYLPERYVIVNTNKPGVFYFEANNEKLYVMDYYFRPETKMSIEEAKKKLPQLFI